jgi:copper transport protein
LLLYPVRAWAHAHLRRSEPAAGSRIIASPQLIRLWFSEQPELTMTFVSLKDATGRAFAVGTPANDQGDALGVSFRVADSLPPGRYTVTWRTAASDGHLSRGSFSFFVSTEAPASTERPAPQAGAVTTVTPNGIASSRDGNEEEVDAASSLPNSLARAFSFVGLLALIGATTFRTLVLPRARGLDPDLAVRMERRAAILGLAASVLVILTALARILLESEMMSGVPGMQAMSMTDMTMHTRWGFALQLELATALVALISFAFATRRSRRAWSVASISAIVLAVTPALAGHAAANPRFTSLLIGSDFLHVLGGASWLGSLLCVMLIGVPISFTLEGAERWQRVAALVNAFSPVALLSAGIVVVSGVIASWVHVQHLAALWRTAYGQVLLGKLALVALTLMMGAYNFRRVQPQLVRQEGTTRLRQSAALELSLGFLILLVTGFLTGISP